MMAPVATSVMDVMATEMEPALGAERLARTEAAMEFESKLSTLGSATAESDTAVSVSAPATADVPSAAVGEAAIEGCLGMLDGDTPAAPQTVSVVGVQGTSVTGIAPLHTLQEVHAVAPADDA